MVEVEVGTPAVSHSLQFDTGSATTWIVSSACDGTDSCPNGSGYNRTSYDAASSSTSEAMGTSASITYLGGTAAGDGVKDAFSVPSSPNLTWTQTFLAADDSSWTNLPADGLLGLAFSTIAVGNTTTLVETLMQDGQLDQPRFGLYYGTELKDTGAGPGSGVLTLGGSHEDRYVDGDMEWTQLSAPSDNAQMWRVDMQYMVGTQPDNSTTTGGKRTTIPLSGAWGIFDTGAGRIAAPEPYLENIYASIGMNYTAILKGEVIPLCADFTDAWSIDLNFGSWSSPTTVTITGDMLKTPGFATGEDIYCWPPVDPSGSDGLFLLGGDFLQLFYTVFDFGGFEPANYTAKFGFGALKEEFKASQA